MDTRIGLRLRTANSAYVGFLDISICCLLVARLDALHSAQWGVVGAAGFAVLFYALLCAERALWPPSESGDDGLAERLDRLGDDIEAMDEDEAPDPWPVRWFFNGVIVVIGALLSIAVVLLSYSRTVLTVIVFAALAPDVEPWAVLLTLVSSIAVQVLISWLFIEPQAKRLGVAL